MRDEQEYIANCIVDVQCACAASQTQNPWRTGATESLILCVNHKTRMKVLLLNSSFIGQAVVDALLPSGFTVSHAQ